MTTSRHRGIGRHRLKDNREEKRFADAWEKQNDKSNICTLAYLLDQRPIHQGGPPEPNDRDCRVAATVIQWLGSPVGQNFLRDLGYEKRT